MNMFELITIVIMVALCGLVLYDNRRLGRDIDNQFSKLHSSILEIPHLIQEMIHDMRATPESEVFDTVDISVPDSQKMGIGLTGNVASEPLEIFDDA